MYNIYKSPVKLVRITTYNIFFYKFCLERHKTIFILPFSLYSYLKSIIKHAHIVERWGVYATTPIFYFRSYFKEVFPRD